MQYHLQVFETEDRRAFRVIEIVGEPWFYGIDLCNALDIKNPSDAYSRLDSDDLGSTEGVDARGRKQSFVIVNESGLYSLILRSEKPEAKRFKKWITSEVLPSIRRTGGYGLRQVPAFIRRFSDNWDRVEAGHFSVLSELVARFWGRLEMAGHILADRGPDGKEIRIDVSVGRLFSDWMKKHHPTVSASFSYYMHKTREWEGEVRQYPVSLLPLFIEFVEFVWIPEHAERYLKPRDAAALPYLPKLLPSPDRPRAGMTRRVTGRMRNVS